METWQVILLSIVVGLTITVIGFIVKASMWAGEVNADRKWLKEAVSSIQDSIQKIFLKLERVDAASSPRVLTDLGKKVAREINADQWAKQLCQSGELRKEVEGMTDYQRQEFCFDFVHNRLRPDANEQRVLEDSAYENGLEVATVRRVLGIVLRDTLHNIIKENPR